MPGLAPEPGLVLRYSYLWRHEHEVGQESGRKIRPCVVVLAVVRSTTGRTRVAVVPITSQKPAAARSAVELPQRVKRHLGLDAERSWVICDEYNAFDWPGVDIGMSSDRRATFGYVPDKLVEALHSAMRTAQERGSLKSVLRKD